MIIKKDSEIVKAKKERRSLALKAKNESKDEEYSTSESKEEKYAMASGDPNHLIGECPKPQKEKTKEHLSEVLGVIAVKKIDEKGLKESRMLKHGELNLVMRNRKITPVIRIGKYELMLKSGVRIDLNNSSPCKGIYEIVKCISHNGNVILKFGSSNELDKSKLWHSHLGHINRKRIAQLQKDGVLESFDFKSYDVYGFKMSVENNMVDKIKGYALETTAHILNLVPTKKVSKTPFEMWKGKCPSLWHIKIWGCEVFFRREAHDKLEARFEKCLFVSYPEESFGYLFYKPKDIVVFVARKGVFLKREMISKEDSGTSGRVRKPSHFYYGFHIEEDKISDSTLSELDEPTNYKEAMASPKAAKWKEAMKSEIQSMYDNQV
ncbi:retrotransposon protein, putative, ty1-copia subclass [Tanacetum coccineum]